MELQRQKNRKCIKLGRLINLGRDGEHENRTDEDHSRLECDAVLYGGLPIFRRLAASIFRVEGCTLRIKVGCSSETRLHNVISKKTAIFIVTSVRTSYLKNWMKTRRPKVTRNYELDKQLSGGHRGTLTEDTAGRQNQ
jgi:hypothetical protein